MPGLIHEVGFGETAPQCPFCEIPIFEVPHVEARPEPPCPHVFLLGNERVITYLASDVRRQLMAQGVVVEEVDSGLELGWSQEPNLDWLDIIDDVVVGVDVRVLARHEPPPSLIAAYVGLARSISGSRSAKSTRVEVEDQTSFGAVRTRMEKAEGPDRPETTSGLRSNAWMRYFEEADAQRQKLAQLERELETNPSAHPNHGYLIYKMRYNRTSLADSVRQQMINEAHMRICQEERDGVNYDVCTCEAMFQVDVGATPETDDFLDRPGHRLFPSERDYRPPRKLVCPRCLGCIPNNDHPGAWIGIRSRVEAGLLICDACDAEEQAEEVTSSDKWPLDRGRRYHNDPA